MEERTTYEDQRPISMYFLANDVCDETTCFSSFVLFVGEMNEITSPR